MLSNFEFPKFRAAPRASTFEFRTPSAVIWAVTSPGRLFRRVKVTGWCHCDAPKGGLRLKGVVCRERNCRLERNSVSLPRIFRFCCWLLLLCVSLSLDYLETLERARAARWKLNRMGTSPALRIGKLRDILLEIAPSVFFQISF